MILNKVKDLLDVLAPQRAAGRRIVFTNGCFDLLHAGHVRYLQAAREAGDLLVVGLNSDRSVRVIKGSLRPVVPQSQRAEVISALACVDHVILFDAPDPGALIAAIRPHVLVKGADWAEADIIGADTLSADGGELRRIPLVPEVSTSQIIQRIAARYGSRGSTK